MTRGRGRSVLVERLRDKEMVRCVAREGEGGQLEM